MKVYGFVLTGMRHIVAAESKAEVARLMGVKGPHALWNLGETGNELAREVAREKPGIVFRQKVDYPKHKKDFEALKPRPEKTEPGKNETKCDGCGRISHDRDFITVDAPDKNTHKLCRGRSWNSHKQSCFDTLLQTLKACPGCGETDKVNPGFICRGCEDKLALAAQMPKGLDWWTIDRFAAFADLDDHELEHALMEEDDSAERHTSDAREYLTRLVAQACTLGRYHGYNREGVAGRVIVAAGRKSSDTFNGVSGPQLETTPTHAKHIAALIGAIARICKAQRLKGREEGRSLLAGLASGELSANEWTKQDKELEKVK
jgi:hypothetical protein